MKPEDWDRLRENFERFLELEGDDLDELIAQECAGNSELASELRNLLAAHKAAEGFLSTSAIVPINAISNQPLFQPGELVAERFRIVRFIAQGGIGQVHEAEDLVLEERVALKAISPGAGKESSWALLKQEIQSARRVTHPNVCRIHDVVEHGGLMLMTMELLAGPTLFQYLKEHGPMLRREALPLIHQMTAGLQSAHDSGVIHRDFKPGNVMLTPGPNGFSLKITDFGLASPMGLAPIHPPLRAGTPGYMAPEQAAGGQVTPSTDVYALGAVIREMVGASESAPSGALPVMVAQRRQGDGHRKKLGPWKRVVERCLLEDPAKRYQRPADVAGAIHRIQRRKRLALTVASCGFLALLLLIVFFWQRSEPPPSGAVIRSVAMATDGYQPEVVSPDGKWLAALEIKTGNLVLLDLRAHGKRHVLLKAANGRGIPAGPYAASPVFSRDGSMIAYAFYVINDHVELRVVDIDGRNDRLLASFPSRAFVRPQDWFPDNSRILTRLSWPGRPMHLALVSVPEGSLTHEVEITDSVENEKVSPNGTEVWFDTSGSGEKGKSGIYAVALLDHSKRALIDDGFNNSLVGISSDGRNMLFLSDRGDQNFLWTEPIGKGTPNGPAEIAAVGLGEWGPLGIRPLGITRTNSFYYFQILQTGGTYVAKFDFDAKKIADPMLPFAPLRKQVAGNLKWSENGRIFFSTASVSGGQLGIMPYILERNGTLRELATGLDSIFDLQWRGRNSLVGYGARKGLWGFYDINTETGEPGLLISSQSLRGIRGDGAWSRDGDTWYNWESDRRTLFHYNVRTGKRRTLGVLKPDMERNDDNLVLSPDGKTLSFISTQPNSGQSSLTLLSTMGGEPQFLWTLHKPAPSFISSAVAWLPDSKGLIVGLSRGEEGELWCVPTNGDAPARIACPSLGVLKNLSLQPDGKKIAVTSTSTASPLPKLEFKVVENFLPRR